MPEGFEQVYRFPDSTEFDGSLCSRIAHDPLKRSELSATMRLNPVAMEHRNMYTHYRFAPIDRKSNVVGYLCFDPC